MAPGAVARIQGLEDSSPTIRRQEFGDRPGEGLGLLLEGEVTGAVEDRQGRVWERIDVALRGRDGLQVASAMDDQHRRLDRAQS